MGKVFVAEYHHIRAGKGGMFRTVPEFKKDLERFYRDGFRPVTVAEYVGNHFQLAPGASPVVFTFDDANPTQFAYLKDGSVDPNCAIGIWQDFAKLHPDFPIKATFYVLPNPWRQPAFVQRKLKYLLSLGCEIGNHTITHPILHKLTDEQVMKEIGGAQLYIQKLGAPAPTSLAFPFGSSPKNKALVRGFVYMGQKIHFTNAMLVGAEPARSPNDPKLDPYRIPRIQANNVPSGLDDWMNQFEPGKVKVFVQ
jgi:peptidoglycan/xylan/chitin deacetylase (PgdA/CDA1 family)